MVSLFVIIVALVFAFFLGLALFKCATDSEYRKICCKNECLKVSAPLPEPVQNQQQQYNQGAEIPIAQAHPVAYG